MAAIARFCFRACSHPPVGPQFRPDPESECGQGLVCMRQFSASGTYVPCLSEKALGVQPNSLPCFLLVPGSSYRGFLSGHRLLGGEWVWTARHLQVRPGQNRRHEHQGIPRPLGRGRLGAAGPVTGGGGCLRGTAGREQDYISRGWGHGAADSSSLGSEDALPLARDPITRLAKTQSLCLLEGG